MAPKSKFVSNGGQFMFINPLTGKPKPPKNMIQAKMKGGSLSPRGTGRTTLHG